MFSNIYSQRKCVIVMLSTIIFSLISSSAFSENGHIHNPSMYDASATDDKQGSESEQNFRKQMRIAPNAKVIYKRIISQQEFEQLKAAQPNMLTSRRKDMGLTIVEQIDVDEPTLSSISESSKGQVDQSKVEVYRKLVDYAEFEQSVEAHPELPISKSMLMPSIHVGNKANPSAGNNANNNATSETREVVVITQMSKQQKAAKPMRQSLKVKNGEAFPDFTLKANDGREIDNQVFRGKLTLINFFFDKCAPCIEETPELNAFAKKHPEIQVFGMTFDSQQQVDDYVKEHQFQWPILSQAGELIMGKLGLAAFPSFALVDEAGNIVGVTQGLGIDIEDGDQKVEKALMKWLQKMRGGKGI